MLKNDEIQWKRKAAAWSLVLYVDPDLGSMTFHPNLSADPFIWQVRKHVWLRLYSSTISAVCILSLLDLVRKFATLVYSRAI